MNVRLLRKVQKHIAKEYRRWSWSFVRPTNESPCGTQACIGGWTCILGQKLSIPLIAKEDKSVLRKINRSIARKLLGLTPKEAQRLFFLWPGQFNPYDQSDAVARIDHFIKTKGAE